MEKEISNTNLEDEGSLYNLSVNRFLLDMIEEARNKGGDEAVLLLVVDTATVKIISSCLKMSDILGSGLIAIEKLELVRAKFPNYQALYFISPTKESINLVVKDFIEESFPQYNKLHLFFSSKCPKENLEELVTPSLVRRLLTCKEFNLAYLLKDQNIFDLGLKCAIQIYPSKDIPLAKKRLIDTTCDRLLTVLATLKEKPYIQYQKNSWVAKSIAECLGEKTENFFKQKINNEKRGIILIMDRTIDKSNPFLYDYSYWPIVQDVIKIKNDTIKSKDGKSPDHILDFKDFVWENHKYNHIVPTIKAIKQELDVFSNSSTAKAMKSDLDSTKEMAKAIRSMKEYQSTVNIFSQHLQLADKFQTAFQAMKLPEVIDIQQEIASGVDKDFNRSKNKDILKKIGLIVKDLDQDTLLRITSLIPINMDMNEQNLKLIIDNKLEEKEMKALFNLKWLGVNFSGISSSGIEKEHNISENGLDKLREEKQNYKTLKTESKVAEYLEQACEGKLSKSVFSSIEDPDKSVFKKKKKMRIQHL